MKKTEELVYSLKQILKSLIDNGVSVFLFGSMSEFNDLSWRVVTELKASHPNIKRVYVRSSYQYIDKLYEEYLLQSYEETYFPLKLKKAGKYSYVERNYEMIDKSSICIFYYNKNYIPKQRQQTKSSKILSNKRNSGTKIAYE